MFSETFSAENPAADARKEKIERVIYG